MRLRGCRCISMEGLELFESVSNIILTEYYSHADMKPRSSCTQSLLELKKKS
jgi:hypothetical protein